MRSQQRFAAAQADGHFKSQIVPVEVPGKKGPTHFVKDEHNRPETTAEGLAKLDEAMVELTSGSLSPMVTGIIYCGAIAGCWTVYELRRAEEWTVAMTRIVGSGADATAVPPIVAPIVVAVPPLTPVNVAV